MPIDIPLEPGAPSPSPNTNTQLPPSLGETATVVGATSLTVTGQSSSMVSNLAFANAVSNKNRSHQNALSLQQNMNGLGIAIVGKAANDVANLGPLEGRSSVDVLTDNALADAIAGLKGAVAAFGGGAGGNVVPGGWGLSALVKMIRQLAKLLEPVMKANKNLQGSGAENDPYIIKDANQPLFVDTPVTLACTNVSADQLKKELEKIVTSAL